MVKTFSECHWGNFKSCINVPIGSRLNIWSGNIWNVPNLLLVGKWWVPSTRAYNVLKMFSLVSRPPCPQCYPPFSFMLIFLYSLFFMPYPHSQTNNKNTFNCTMDHQTTWSTGLPTSQNSPVLPPQPDPAPEPSQLPLLTPTVQSSRLPRHGMWVGVHPPHEAPCWLQGSSSVPQQDRPDRLPPFYGLRPLTLQGIHWIQLEQGRSLHQPPGSQWHHPTGSL